MKVKCIVDDVVDLTINKVYEAEIEFFHGHELYSIRDDNGDGLFLYAHSLFEIVEQ